MATKEFSAEVLDWDVVYSTEGDHLERISDEIVLHSRWSVEHFLVFREKATGNVYSVSYLAPATERQEVDRWDAGPDGTVSCLLMKAVEVTRTEYVIANDWEATT